jgi:diguanylate cyclase (GGDEF)-like protein
VLKRQLDIFSHLQACRTAEDAHHVLAQGAQQLLPTTSGALYVRHDPADFHVEVVATWGKALQAEPAFKLHQCQALRLMKVVENTQAPAVCQHAELPQGGSYLCVPLMAEGQASGLLHIESSSGGLTSQQQQLALDLAQQGALALHTLQFCKQLEERATRDSLTGLYNRYFMHESLEREVARAIRSQVPVGIIMIDIDHFKGFNTRFTHVGGDAMLRAVGRFLEKQIRGEDVACRYGGEEFLLILPGASLRATRQRAEKMRKEIKQLKVGHEDTILDPVTLSLGVAVYPRHGNTSKSVLRAVAEALSQAKQQGRDRVMVATALQPA